MLSDVLSLCRMKKAVTYLFVVFLAALVFYGGAGVNLVTYCCGDCRTEGVTALLEDKCCEIHEHEHPATAGTDACCHTESEDEGCDVERIYFDWNTIQSSLQNLQPVVIDLASSVFSNTLSFVPDPFAKIYKEAEKEDPPILCPQIYLSLLTTLLI